MNQSILTNRNFFSLSGEDKFSFLQGLITNDIHSVTPSQGIWSAILTPQGKYLYDIIIFQRNDDLIIDCLDTQANDLKAFFRRYQLRAKVRIQDISDQINVSVIKTDSIESPSLHNNEPGNCITENNLILLTDPRHSGLGVRVYWQNEDDMEKFSMRASFITSEQYKSTRMHLGIPEGPDDLPSEKAIPLECNFDEMNGINWDKGCYLGQELTARTKHRGLVRKKLFPGQLLSGSPEKGEDIFFEGKKVGQIRSLSNNQILAILRLEFIANKFNTPINFDNNISVKFHHPDWIQIS